MSTDFSAMPSFRRVPAASGLRWWGDGWRSFTQSPLPWVGLAAAFLAALWLLGRLPLGGLLSQWLSLPLLALGVIFAASLRRRAARAQAITPPGMPVEPQDEGTLAASAQVWRTRIGALLTVSLLVLLLGGVIGAVVVVLLAAMLGIGLGGLTAFTHGMGMGPGMRLAAGMGAMAGSMLALMLLLLLVLYLLSVAFWFVNTLVALGGVRPWDAVKLSARAGFANLAPITVFTVLLLPISLLAMLPMGLGLLVLFPVLSGASAASYHEVFGAEPTLVEAAP